MKNILFGLLLFISCSQPVDNSSKIKDLSDKKFDRDLKRGNDSLDQVRANIRLTGSIAREKILQGWKREKLDKWENNFLDSLNRNTAAFWNHIRKQQDTLYQEELKKLKGE